MDKSYKRIYPTNREFKKSFKFNNYMYTLRSIFDSNDELDFDQSITYNKHDNEYKFNKRRKSVKDIIDYNTLTDEDFLMF